MAASSVVMIALVVLLILLIIRVPIAFALLAAGTLGVVMLHGMDVANSTLSELPYSATAKYSLLVIPMFILMGGFALHAGVAEGVFRLGARWFGKLPGGLAIATVFVCAGFAAVTGSSVATVAAIAPLATTEMRNYGYSNGFSAALIASAGTLGVLIPPSLVMVVYGIMTGESIGAMLIAGLIPGIISALAYSIYMIWRFRLQRARLSERQPDSGLSGVGLGSDAPPKGHARGPQAEAVVEEGSGQAKVATRASRVKSLEKPPRTSWKDYISLLKVSALFLSVVGGVYLGLYTATEAGAMGAFLALILLLTRRGRGKLRKIAAALGEAASTTSMIFAIIVGGTVFAYFLVSAGVPSAFTRAVLSVEAPGLVIILLLLLAIIPLGMVLDGFSILLITVPLAYPIVTELGFDGIWFGVLMVKMIELGLITPPVGLNAYVAAGAVEGVSVEEVFRSLIPFAAIDAAVVAVLVAFPILTLALPAQM